MISFLEITNVNVRLEASKKVSPIAYIEEYSIYSRIKKRQLWFYGFQTFETIDQKPRQLLHYFWILGEEREHKFPGNREYIIWKSGWHLNGELHQYCLCIIIWIFRMAIVDPCDLLVHRKVALS